MNMINTSEISQNLFSYIKAETDCILNTDFNTLARIAEKLVNAKINGQTIYTAGNGGSATTASHMVNDLIKGCRVHGREGLRAICLNDSTPVITCLANDFSYREIYTIQLNTLAKSGDILVVFSGSGNSQNIVDVIKRAKEMGIYTIGFSGKDGGLLKGLCDILLIAPTYSMEQLEDFHLIYEHAIVTIIRDMLSDLWGMEIIKYPAKGSTVKSALFDFDGTISLIREDWQNVMIPYFIQVLMESSKDESMEEIKMIVIDFVDKLTGKQTIFQCIKLDEEVVKRGGTKTNPLEYKNEYLSRLNEKIKYRLSSLDNKTVEPSQYIVPGCVEFIKKLKELGIKLYLASGTDEQDVIREAKLLGVYEYFDGGIYGAKDNITECSKELVIAQILKENEIAGNELVLFGDGYVEMELAKDIGGYTVALATDEVRRFGINEWKRKRLIDAGANVVIPDFSNAKIIIDFLIRRK